MSVDHVIRVLLGVYIFEDDLFHDEEDKGSLKPAWANILPKGWGGEEHQIKGNIGLFRLTETTFFVGLQCTYMNFRYGPLKMWSTDSERLQKMVDEVKPLLCELGIQDTPELIVFPECY